MTSQYDKLGSLLNEALKEEKRASYITEFVTKLEKFFQSANVYFPVCYINIIKLFYKLLKNKFGE